MLIRDADPARDAVACAAIYAPSVTDGVASFEERAPSAEEMAVRIAETSARWPWLVAEPEPEPEPEPEAERDRDGGPVVGFAYATRHRARSAYRWAIDVSVYVDAAHHRTGVGRALYEALLARIAAQGYYEALAGITLPNDASVALHESLGFAPVGVYRRIGFKFGRWHDVGWWQRSLRERVPGQRPAEPGAPDPRS